ncbi:hypothetical protein ACFQU2_11820 [Siccirubricoccus deserti]
MHRRSFFAAAALAAPAFAPALAQGRWPARELQLVTGFGPGGGTDVVARAIAAHMEKSSACRWWCATPQAPAARSGQPASPSHGRMATPSAWSASPPWWWRR